MALPTASGVAVNEHWKDHFEHDIAFHRKTAAIYDHVNSEPRILANASHRDAVPAHALRPNGNVVAALWKAT